MWSNCYKENDVLIKTLEKVFLNLNSFITIKHKNT